MTLKRRENKNLVSFICFSFFGKAMGNMITKTSMKEKISNRQATILLSQRIEYSCVQIQ